LAEEAVETGPGRSKIKSLEAMVGDVVKETADTSTLFLFTGNERLDYQPGHFLIVDPHQFESLERFTAFLEDMKVRKSRPERIQYRRRRMSVISRLR
jgi:3-ketosteroid 9alpha-monooxygenase subunit B